MEQLTIPKHIGIIMEDVYKRQVLEPISMMLQIIKILLFNDDYVTL